MFFRSPLQKNEDGNLKSPHWFVSRNMGTFGTSVFFLNRFRGCGRFANFLGFLMANTGSPRLTGRLPKSFFLPGKQP